MGLFYRGDSQMAEGWSVKPAPAISWSGVEEHESALVERCLQGDETACAALVDGHQRMVYQLALHLLGDPQEALDLSQDVFLQVFRSLPRFRGQSALRTWIYRIVVTQARNRQRWWRRRLSHAQVSLDDHVRSNGEFPTTMISAAPDRVLSQKELARQLWSALEDLPFEQRTAIVLREIDGLSYEEIAFSLGVAVGTVRSRLARARESLRSQLRGL
jgi:RNA polymerase sigma-70 factor (ECF subfamily)